MNKLYLTILLLSITSLLFSNANAESSERGIYLASEGKIIPPEEIHIEDYISAIDYNYEKPVDDLDVTLYPMSSKVSQLGQDYLIQIGLQGQDIPLEKLPPLNIVFVVDISSSMNDKDKINWIKKGLNIYLEQVRSIDYVSIVTFSDSANIIFPSTQLNSPQKIERLRSVISSITPTGGSNLEKGIEAGYKEILTNYSPDKINRVLFLSDGTEFSSRLRSSGAQTGDIRISLIWENYNDLDLHVITPKNEEIYYSHKRSMDNGYLDVDMNAGGRNSNKPVENIFWPKGQAIDGVYRVFAENFAYHDDNVRGEYPFKLEIKNGDELSYFSGTVDGKKDRSKIFEFEYKTSTAKKREKALIYQLASTYKNMGINITTIGVGVEFDEELMDKLAKEGGGSSRFLSGDDEINDVFGTGFTRMVVPLANDVKINFDFLSDVQNIETWGHNNKVEGLTVSYSIPTFHLGDYVTLIIRCTIPPSSQTTMLPLGRLSGTYIDSRGTKITLDDNILDIEIVSEVSNDNKMTDMVLKSSSILDFAKAIKKIGTLYYRASDNLAMGNEDIGYETLIDAYETTVFAKENLIEAKNRLNDEETFTDYISILENYIETIYNDIPSHLLDLGNSYNTDIDLDVLKTVTLELSRKITSEIIGSDNISVIVSDLNSDGIEVNITDLINEYITLSFNSIDNVSLIDRDNLDIILQEQQLTLTGLTDINSMVEIGRLSSAQYVITGNIIALDDSYILFARLIDVTTGEIIKSEQVNLPK